MPKRSTFVEGQGMMLLPESAWVPPHGPLPLPNTDIIALDTETQDRGLAASQGPGWVFDDGYLCGVSMAWSGGSIYVPVAHENTECRDIGQVIAWVEMLFRRYQVVFFNAPYDMGWLWQAGCRVWPERMEDAAIQAVMLDENHDSYSLDACCAREGIPGKDMTALEEIASCYGIQKNHARRNIWRFPARYVGPYAEQDAASTLGLYHRLAPQVREQELEGAYRTEIDLVPVLHHMRLRGIRINESGARKAQEDLKIKAEEALAQIPAPPQWHRGVVIDDLRSADQLGAIFDAEGVPYPRTPKTNKPSFQRTYLERLQHPVGKAVRRARQLWDLQEKFLGQYILQYQHNGRIHAEVHQLRDDEGGARTHRFSYSNPPLQQMPSRDQELAPIIRNVFLPEQGSDWLAADFAGQEPRLNVHYAYLSAKSASRYGISMGKIEELVQEYANNPRLDLHQRTADILGRTRREVKDWTQALTYRAGAQRLSELINEPLENAERYYEEFHAAVPYLKGLAQFCEKRANMVGYVRMIDGARRHFSLWQPKHEGRGEGWVHGREAAEKKWPNQTLERAFTYQAGNSVIQGSAARQMKRAMVVAYREGILPALVMHDEMDVSVRGPEECAKVLEIMRTAVQLVVPVEVDAEVGPSWGKAKTDYREYYRENAA